MAVTVADARAQVLAGACVSRPVIAEDFFLFYIYFIPFDAASVELVIAARAYAGG